MVIGGGGGLFEAKAVTRREEGGVGWGTSGGRVWDREGESGQEGEREGDWIATCSILRLC